MDYQLTIKTSEPHHLTVLQYPAFDLLIPRAERPMLLPPQPARFHWPEPLIGDPQVIESASRENVHETAVFTVDRASASELNPHIPLLEGRKSPLSRFIHDTTMYQRTIGTTTLKTATYIRNAHEQMVRIKRDSFVLKGGGTVHTNVRSHDFPLHDLLSIVPAPSFVRQMQELLTQNSARALLHEQLNLDKHAIPDSLARDIQHWSFKPKRQMNYLEVACDVLAHVDPQALETEEDQRCCICLDTLGEQEDGRVQDAEDPVKLPCKHVFGEDCICRELALQMTGQLKFSPFAAKCPVCRQNVIPKDATFGVFNKEYRYDHRYSAFENHERSCADLDDHVDAHDDDTLVRPEPSVLLRAMLHLIEEAKHETERECPRCLQPCHFPELADAVIEIAKACKEFEGEEMTVSDLSYKFETRVRFAQLEEAFTPIRNFLSESIREELTKSSPYGLVVGIPLRPGLEAFVERLVSRAIRFQKVRPCGCTLGFHKHGLRLYYDNRATFGTEEVLDAWWTVFGETRLEQLAGVLSVSKSSSDDSHSSASSSMEDSAVDITAAPKSTNSGGKGTGEGRVT